MRLLLLLITIYPLFASAILRLKLKEWFPSYRTYFLAASEGCNAELENYWNDVRTGLCQNPCACAADCLLSNLPGTIQTNMASAAVLLGLIPPTLIFTGPTIADMAALSLYDPLLAVLLSFASPAVNLQILRREDIIEEIEKPVSRTFRHYQQWLDRHRYMKPVMTLLKWLLALAALANNVSTSVYLDLRTICGWRCGALFMPLVWSLLGSVVHFFPMLGARLRKYSKRAPFWRHTWKDLPGSHDTAISECLMWAGSILAIIQLIFGILDLSSLVFISALDALPTAARYGMSALVCQIILLTEFASLRLKLKDELSEHSTDDDQSHTSEKAEHQNTQEPTKDLSRRGNSVRTW